MGNSEGGGRVAGAGPNANMEVKVWASRQAACDYNPFPLPPRRKMGEGRTHGFSEQSLGKT